MEMVGHRSFTFATGNGKRNRLPVASRTASHRDLSWHQGPSLLKNLGGQALLFAYDLFVKLAKLGAHYGIATGYAHRGGIATSGIYAFNMKTH